jgi:hypothetical protein
MGNFDEAKKFNGAQYSVFFLLSFHPLSVSHQAS